MVINGTENCNTKKNDTYRCQNQFLDLYLFLAVLKPLFFRKVCVLLLCFHISIVACWWSFEKKRILRIFLKFREKTV